MEGLTVGRVVHCVAYGTPGGEYQAGAHRAAIVVEVEVDAPNSKVTTGRVNLLVMNPTGIHFNWASYSAEPQPGTWHWIEQV